MTNSADAALRDALRAPYARVFYAEPEGGYSTALLEWPGCFSSGDTLEDAMAELEDAMRVWLESRLARGLPIPPPIRGSDHKTRMSVQLPMALRERIAELALAGGMSQNRWITEALLGVAMGANAPAQAGGRIAEEPPSYE